MSSHGLNMKIPVSRIIDQLWTPASVMVLAPLFVKAWMDFDPSWDSWSYHLPYAGRLWGIVPAESYRMEQFLEDYYLGLPKLGEWLQGMFWTASGHLQAANLVCLSSLVLYALFLRVRFGLPFGASSISLLAIPLVQIHVTSCYVDLPGNLALSALILLTWQLFHRTELRPRRDVLPLFPPAMIAAHFKFQLIPVVLMILLIALAIIILLIRSVLLTGARSSGKNWRWLAFGAFMAFLTFYVPIKNAKLYGNPFYPLRITIGPIVLNHRQPLYWDSPQYLHDSLPPERWLFSVLEINRPFGAWQIGQLALPVQSEANRMGGFFGVYVVLQLTFLLVFCVGTGHFDIDSIVYFGLISMIASWLPQSHELRYYLFWMITLVTLNLILLYRGNRAQPLRIIIPTANLTALLVVILLTKGFYILPQGITLDNLPMHIKQLEPFPWVPASVDHQVLERIRPHDDVCIAGQQPITWLYASHFHPPKSYRIVAALDAQACK